MGKKVLYGVAVVIVVVCSIVLFTVLTNEKEVALNINLVNEIGAKSSKEVVSVQPQDKPNDALDILIEPSGPVMNEPAPEEPKSIIVTPPPIRRTQENTASSNTVEDQKMYKVGDIVGAPKIVQTPTPATTSVNEETQAEAEKAARNVGLEKVPVFTVIDNAGKPLSFSAMADKPVVITVWSTSNAASVKDLKMWQQMYDTYKSTVVFLFINSAQGAETHEVVAKFLKDNGYTLPVAFDDYLNFMSLEGIYSLPQTFFINKDGYLVKRQIGAISENDAKTNIEAINN